MFGIGFFELIVIAVCLLLFVGPSKLPEVARQFGRFFVQMRRVTTDVRKTVDTVIRDAEEEIRKEERETLRNLLSTGAPAAAPDASQDQGSLHQDGHHDGHHHDEHHHNDHGAVEHEGGHHYDPYLAGDAPFDASQDKDPGSAEELEPTEKNDIKGTPESESSKNDSQ